MWYFMTNWDVFCCELLSQEIQYLYTVAEEQRKFIAQYFYTMLWRILYRKVGKELCFWLSYCFIAYSVFVWYASKIDIRPRSVILY